MNALRILAIICLVFLVLITALLCFFFSICAFNRSVGGNSQGQFLVLDLVDIGVMIAALVGIVKLAKQKP
jgi:hypothetical protein